MAKLEAKHLEYLRNQEFFEKYKNLLLARLTYSNNKLEEDGLEIDELYAAEHTDTLDDNIEVLEIIINQIRFIYELRNSLNNTNDEKTKEKIKKILTQSEKLNLDFIIEIANIINRNAANGNLTLGFRTSDNNVKFENKYPIEKAANIRKKMRELLDNYYNDWSELDVFEREARFNIEFLRIHPFDDGNGRTSRLILNYNLLIQGHAPVLLPSSIKNKYFAARNRENVEWIQKLFKRESEKELFVLNHLIDKMENKYNVDNERGYSL